MAIDDYEDPYRRCIHGELAGRSCDACYYEKLGQCPHGIPFEQDCRWCEEEGNLAA